MIKRSLCILFVAFFCLIFSGCDKDMKKPYLLFNAQPINQKTVYDAQKIFKPRQTIYYVILMPKGFKYGHIKVQIIKRADVIPQGGLNVAYAHEFFIEPKKKQYQFHIDKFVLHQPGCYVVRLFYANKLEKPFAENVLWVKE